MFHLQQLFSVTILPTLRQAISLDVCWETWCLELYCIAVWLSLFIILKFMFSLDMKPSNTFTVVAESLLISAGAALSIYYARP